MNYDKMLCEASVERLNQVIDFVEECADRFGLETKKKFGMLIAVEEAFVNVCHYAYQEGEGKVSFACGADDDTVVVEVSDNGCQFDVLSLPEPDTTSDVMDRQIGGLGIHFIRKLTDSVSYRWENGQNILRLEFLRTQDSIQ